MTVALSEGKGGGARTIFAHGVSDGHDRRYKRGIWPCCFSISQPPPVEVLLPPSRAHLACARFQSHRLREFIAVAFEIVERAAPAQGHTHQRARHERARRETSQSDAALFDDARQAIPRWLGTRAAYGTTAQVEQHQWQMPSRKMRSAAFTASAALRQRTHSSRASAAGSTLAGFEPTAPSISTTHCRRLTAPLTICATASAPPPDTQCNSAMSPFGSPSPAAASSAASPRANALPLARRCRDRVRRGVRGAG